MDLVSFRETAERYSVIFLDAYGVLKSSTGLIEGSLDVVRSLIDDGKEVFVVTNDSSRSPESMAERYNTQAGCELLPASRYISSGMLASEYLENQVPYGKVAYLGKPESAHYIEIAGKIPVQISHCSPKDHIVGIVLLDDEGFDWFRDVNATLNLIRRVNCPVIVANADITYPMKGNDIAIAVGSLGGLLSQITEKTFVRFGKPDSMMFAYALARAREQLPNVTKRDVLFVGDTLRTDILGSNTYGFDSTLVLSGNTLPETADLMIRASGIIPTYISESIAT
ncbi:MAG: HAD-IIA family hydrolase [Deltaproteobacteria bacterium]|jgi:HAD superfamily hydrolase (TIGR01450 family)|nr:HAD-IIA family hydrolase [Deltaproteobacteria bacterium]